MSLTRHVSKWPVQRQESRLLVKFTGHDGGVRQKGILSINSDIRYIQDKVQD